MKEYSAFFGGGSGNELSLPLLLKIISLDEWRMQYTPFHPPTHTLKMPFHCLWLLSFLGNVGCQSYCYLMWFFFLCLLLRVYFIYLICGSFFRHDFFPSVYPAWDFQPFFNLWNDVFCNSLSLYFQILVLFLFFSLSFGFFYVRNFYFLQCIPLLSVFLRFLFFSLIIFCCFKAH